LNIGSYFTLTNQQIAHPIFSLIYYDYRIILYEVRNISSEDDMPSLPAQLATVGRVILVSLFLLGGLNKLLNYDATLAMMQRAGLNPAPLLLPAVIALELGGGALVAFGKRFAVPAALALAIFTIATNLVFHRFWAMSGPVAALELSLFFKNVAISGGLLFVAATLAQQDTR
jgi:putative oxidoreductase